LGALLLTETEGNEGEGKGGEGRGRKEKEGKKRKGTDIPNFFRLCGDHPRRGVLNSLELPNDAVSDSNQ